MREVIIKNLKKSWTTVEKDCESFKLWEKGEISLHDCKVAFGAHNRITKKQFDLISDESFERWLNSLGYDPSLPITDDEYE